MHPKDFYSFLSSHLSYFFSKQEARQTFLMKADVSTKPGRALRRDLQLQERAGVGLQPANRAVLGGFCFSLGWRCLKSDLGCSQHDDQVPSEVS